MENNQIQKAVEALKNGKVIAYPTETIYGLGADIFNEKAIQKIFNLKGRSFDKPLSVMVSSFDMIENIAVVSDENRVLIRKLLPGSVTVLLLKKDNVLDIITRGSKLIGIRFPKKEEAREAIEIIEQAGFPIIATSANISGEKEASSADEINLAVDFIVKGECKYKIVSTVVDLIDKKILREGIDIYKTKKVLGV